MRVNMDLNIEVSEEVIIKGLVDSNPHIPKTCLEVGAADGIWLSNTHRLWKDERWKALLIEADDGNFENLKKNVQGYDAIPVHSRIEPEGENSLDALIMLHSFPDEIGVMSIDIDGEDYRIFEGLNVRPWIVVVEFNATIPPGPSVVGAEGSRLGCSATALAILAAKKEYLVCTITGSNMILVKPQLLRSEYVMCSLGLARAELEFGLEYINKVAVKRHFKDHSLSYLVQNYDGTWAILREPVFGMKDHMKGQVPEVLWVPK